MMLTAHEMRVDTTCLAKKHEEIYLPSQTVPLHFEKNSRMMLLLRKIRDATHDFSIAYHRKKRALHLRDEFKSDAVSRKK